MIRGDDGAICTEPKDIEDVIVNFYKRLFTSSGALYETQKQTITAFISKQIPREACDMLVAQPSIQGVGCIPFYDVGGGARFYQFYNRFPYPESGLSQSAFIPGRNLGDSVLMLQALVQGYHKEDGVPRAAIKIDLQKAYAMVE
ncbi:hypothetical protein LIER_26054 [Lithospermum erythrorhizon]|uniref:Reverse transcriptase domain-containing protein n=1 Tax=Lithospermum erythrorhizon TaxID=34254 RepID=A0AAV3R8A8_LITER